jgi:autotransporter-associated beta strand protein
VKSKIALVLAVPTLAFTLSFSSSFAGLYTWNDTNGDWAADSNWSGGTAPSGSVPTDTLSFGDRQGTSYMANNDLATVPSQFNQISANSTGTFDQINLTGNQVQLVGSGAELAQNGVGELNVANDLNLAANTTVGGTGSGVVVLTGAISGSSGLTINYSGSGGVILYGASSYAGGTVVNAGTLEVANTGPGTSATGTGSVTVNAGATVIGEGTISGTVNVNNGGTLLGGGLTVGALNVNKGGDISPTFFGTGGPSMLNAGNTLFAPGGKYTFEVNDFTGTKGVDPGWDLLNITGTLDLSNLSPVNPFIIQLNSLTIFDGVGAAANFNQYSDYSLLIASASGGFVGNFASDLFQIDTSGFQNANSGFWTVTDPGGSLDLNYTAVPEPSMAMLWLSGCGIFALRFLLFRRSSAKATEI